MNFILWAFRKASISAGMVLQYARRVAGRWRPLSTVLVVVALVGPASAQSADTVRPDWRGTGVVLAVLPPPSDLHTTRPVIVLHHDPIVGLMPERMAMPFLVASPALFQGIQPGDRVAFGLKETPDALLVVTLERLPPPARSGGR
jgi:Cu/Ag efflux protein CusF